MRALAIPSRAIKTIRAILDVIMMILNAIYLMDQEVLDQAVLGHTMLQLVTRNARNSITSRFNMVDNAFVGMHTARRLNIAKYLIANAAALTGKAVFSEIKFTGHAVRIEFISLE